MAVIKTIGKLAPGAYKQMIDHLTRKKIKNPFIKAKNIVVDKKPEVERTEMFNRFNVANPRQDMAGGGMLVQPGFGGTRQGYREPRDMIEEPLTSYEKIKLKKKFPKTKFNFKEYSNIGVSSYDNNYDSIRRYISRGFVDTTKFKVLPVSVQNEIKGQFPEVKNWDFKKYAYGVSPGRIGERERRLKGLPPKDNRALVRKIARFVDEPEEFRYKFRVGNADGFMLYSMDRAFLQGNKNYKPIKQGGKVVGFIDYTKDGGGKKYYYNGYIVNNKLKSGEKIIKDHPDFKKVKKFHEVSLRSKLSLDDTSDVFKQLFPKGFDTSKIKFNDLVQFVSNKASKRNIYNAIVKHHTTGVGTNPTKDLQILTSVFNKQADDIKALIKKGDFSRVQELKEKGIRIVVDGKAYGAPRETAERGYQRILSNVVEDVKTFKQKDFKNLKKFLASFGDGSCAVQFGKPKKDGGRIGYATGPASLDNCLKSGAKNLNEGKLKTADQVQDAAKLLRGGRAVLSALSKYGIVPELAYVGLEAAGRTVLGEKPTNALLKSIDTLTFGATDFTSEIEAEKFGEYAKDKLAVDAFRGSQAKVRSILNNLEKLEQINLEGGDVDVTQELQTLRAQLKSASDELRANTVNPDLVQFIDKRQEEISDAELANAPLSKQSLTSQLEGFPGIKDYMDTEATRVFPFQQTQKQLNEKVLSSLFDVKDAMQYTTSDAINIAQRLRAEGQDISAKDILAYRDSLRNTNLSGFAESGEYSPTSIYGASETFSTPLPSGALDKKPNVIPEIEREIVGQTNVANPFDIDISDIGSGLRGFAAAGGGIAKEAGDRSGPPPERGPNSQGLLSLTKRGMKI